MGVMNAVHGELLPGSLLTWSRRYGREDVAAFDGLSGRVPPAADQDHLPCLLVVAPLTKLGGDLDYLARKMVWTHARPVRVGEELTAELEITSLTENEGFHRIVFDARIRADAGDVVVSGTSKGMILAASPGPEAPGGPQGDSGPHGDGDREGAKTATSTAARPPAAPALLEGLAAGAVLRHSNRLTGADIDLCADLTGDRGAHHALGPTGRQMAQGLLTATGVPLLRGDGGFHVRTMSMVFLQPVFAGDELESEVRVATPADAPGEVGLTTAVRNAEGVDVLVSECTGSLPGARSTGE